MCDRRYLTHDEVQHELINLLVVFDSICRDKHLRYSLTYGTLLGAIRHKGFIPWDDDIDVSMARPDYERLLAAAGELPSGFLLLTCDNSDFAYPYAKFCNEAVRAQGPGYLGVFNEPLWLDVFPMDGAPSNQRLLKRNLRDANKAIRRNVWATVNHSHEHGLKKVVKKACGAFLKHGDQRGRMQETAQRIVNNPGYENSDRVCDFLGGGKKGWSIPKSEYETMVKVTFEGHELPAMGCWDEFLTKCYGAYMQLPPIKQRVNHQLKAWYTND